jgi:hypothetical protein
VVHEIDARTAARLRGELYFDLARLGEIGLELPFRVDLPRDDEPARRIPRSDRAPRPFGAVGFASVAAAAEPRFDDGFFEFACADVMFAGPPGIEAFGEDFEGVVVILPPWRSLRRPS